MDIVFSRFGYFVLGSCGLALDFLAHYAQVCMVKCDAVPVLYAMIGFDPRFLDRPAWIAFGVGAHSMFLLAFALLAIRSK